MTSPISSAAISGLNAASLRIEAASRNIANASSTSRIENGQVVNQPFEPVDVVQISDEAAGVIARIEETGADPVQVFDPENPSANEEGIVQVPNVDLVQQQIELIDAAAAFRANLNVVSVSEQISDRLLDIFA